MEDVRQIEIKCPCCGKFIDKVKSSGVVEIVRKHKFCGNYIKTIIQNGKITQNQIDLKENSYRTLRNSYRSP